MPKEMIQDEAQMYDVHVGWGREQVQVGVETHGGESLVEKLGEGGKDTDAAQFRGVWGTLDRQGVNLLIRTLRRARDQAFGRDE
jgi:hypothetical protein